MWGSSREADATSWDTSPSPLPKARTSPPARPHPPAHPHPPHPPPPPPPPPPFLPRSTLPLWCAASRLFASSLALSRANSSSSSVDSSASNASSSSFTDASHVSRSRIIDHISASYDSRWQRRASIPQCSPSRMWNSSPAALADQMRLAILWSPGSEGYD